LENEDGSLSPATGLLAPTSSILGLIRSFRFRFLGCLIVQKAESSDHRFGASVRTL